MTLYAWLIWAAIATSSTALIVCEAWRAPEEPAPEPVRLRLVRGGRA